MTTAAHPAITIAKKATTWSIVLSVFMLLAGLLAIIIPPVASIAVTILVGWLLIFSGVAHLVFAWHQRSTGSLLWQFLLGVVYIWVGIYLLVQPVAGMASLTLALAIYLFAAGILEFIMGVRLRPRPGTGWLFLNAVVSIILAIMIWRTWPSSIDWVLGLLVGCGMFFSGITRLMLSLAARSLIARTAP